MTCHSRNHPVKYKYSLTYIAIFVTFQNMSDALPTKEFEALFREYFRPLVVFAKQYVKVQEVAEDIVQDLFLYIFEREKPAETHDLKGPYLYKLVHYRCLNHLEYQSIRKKKNPEAQHRLSFNPHDPLEFVKQIELENKYLQVLEGLSPKCRKVFEMSRLEGMKNQEIADQMNLSKRTIETHITNALKTFREKMSEYLRVILF